MGSYYNILGGNPLYGNIDISGAKNSALPIMAASLLTDEDIILHNVPQLVDIMVMKDLLVQLGKSIEINANTMIIKQTPSVQLKAAYEVVRTMRASITVLGPLLSRYGRAIVSLPGGCSIGNRPVDLHIKAMEILGAEIYLEDGYIYAKTIYNRLKGKDLYLVSHSGVTVLGTANALMAATLAEGQTIIDPAATEPEIGDLIDFLEKMGAKIQGRGTSTLVINGVEKLLGAEHTIIADRIEAGTFLSMVACTGGDVTLHKISPSLLKFPLTILKEMGLELLLKEDSIRIISQGKINPVDIVTMPYPGFPTDLQPQYMIMLALALGESKLSEQIFEDRLHHVAELLRMGAKLSEESSMVYIKGVSYLKGAPVVASDLRAGAALVIAGLAAKGETIVDDIYHIDRGYENFEKKITGIGGQIKRLS